jgi:hypothetical protein
MDDAKGFIAECACVNQITTRGEGRALNDCNASFLPFMGQLQSEIMPLNEEESHPNAKLISHKN